MGVHNSRAHPLFFLGDNSRAHASCMCLSFIKHLPSACDYSIIKMKELGTYIHVTKILKWKNQ